jgi:hypothetical protein
MLYERANRHNDALNTRTPVSRSVRNKFPEVLIRFLQLKAISERLAISDTRMRMTMMPIEETPADDTVGSGSHRLILHVGAIVLGVMVLVGATPLGSAIFGR